MKKPRTGTGGSAPGAAAAEWPSGAEWLVCAAGSSTTKSAQKVSARIYSRGIGFVQIGCEWRRRERYEKSVQKITFQ